MLVDDKQKYWLMLTVTERGILLPEYVLKQDRIADLFGENLITAWSHNGNYVLELTEKGEKFLDNMVTKSIDYLCAD